MIKYSTLISRNTIFDTVRLTEVRRHNYVKTIGVIILKELGKLTL